MTRSVLCVVGTRPEAIKMAPLIRALRADPFFRCRVLATAQHRQMLDQVLSLFNITADIDLDIMRPDQNLTALTGRLLDRLGGVLAAEKPDIVLAQGDTTTVMTTALAAFYAGIPLGHVEAGLRTGNLRDPFPEEMNRVMTSRMTRWHFAPTARAADNLRAEALDAAGIFVTGNTVIDALRLTQESRPQLPVAVDPARRLILVTLHRRENFGAPLQRILAALEQIRSDNPDMEMLIPVHPNPNVHGAITAHFGTSARVLLTDPLDYRAFIAAMARSHLILTDSGGVQEEAPALGKPVLVLRETTERPEAVAAGVSVLVGTETAAICAQTQTLLDDPAAYARMVTHRSPYGDGFAAGRIVEVLRAA